MLLGFSLSVLLKVRYCNYVMFFHLDIVQFLGYLHWQEKFTLSLFLCYVSIADLMKEWHKVHFCPYFSIVCACEGGEKPNVRDT